MSGLSQLSSTIINDRFCGREEELKILSDKLSNFNNSQTSLLLIEGPAGIGKTSLVQKVLEGYRNKKCFKLYGKFENQQENAPYRALKQAFKDWANQILLLDDEQLNEVKEAATSALQTNITAVTSVFTELEVFFSRKQLVNNTSYQADPIQIKARFYYFFKKFLRSITATGNHLIIFMDDLQWADRASILLLEELASKNEVPNLIFVTTYRPLEKNSYHFEKTEKFKQLGNSAYWLLKPLPKQSVDLMIPDQWNFSPQNADAFKKYLWHETHGNPFKIKEILKTVQREKLNTSHAEEDVHFWENLPKYSKEKGSVAFIKDQLARLPEHQIKVISTASCLGFSFTSEQLETAMNLSNSEVIYDLSEITAKDFLIKKDKFYVFVHDTILSAANSFLSVEDKCELHQKTGLHQLSKLQHYNQHEFFSAVNHLNRAEKLEMSVQLAEEAGDPHYASFCSTDVRVLNTYSGKNLEDHLAYCEELEKKHPHIYFISSSDNQLSYYLTGQKTGFAEGKFEFPEELVRESGYNMSSRFHMLLVLQQLYYLSGNYDSALNAGRECNELKNVYAGFQIELEHFLFYSLTLLKEAFLNPDTFPDAMKIVEPKLEEFRRLSQYRSGNFYHKVLLLEAEIAKCEGNFERATFLYDEAILEAKKNSFIHHAAIAAELAFEYYLIKGRKKPAQTYFNQAIKFYTSWGAKAKVEKLKTDYPELTKEKKARGTSPQPAIPYDIIKNIISRTVPGQKVELTELGDYLISRLVSHANARKGNILVLRENIWKVLAASGYEDDRMMTDKTITQLQNKLPVKLLNFSIKKGSRYNWFNAAKEPLFSDETYLQKIKTGRIVTYPVKQNSETVGLIYLEDVKIITEEEQALFSVIIELVCTTLANSLYYENNDILNRELKLQERKKIEAIIESQEKERQRIATELHDSLGQVLALTKLIVSQLSTDENSVTDNLSLITKISDLVDESCIEVRTISYNLMPPDLDRKSISEILENLVKKNSGSGGTDYHFEAFGISNELSVAFKFTLYRILQEIIHNITKHASASKVTINLSQTEDFVYLLVEDNGLGFDKNLVNLGLGLKNIHSRIKLLNGYLDVNSSINDGTVFNVSIPLKP